ncbi:MAG: phage holin family protein [Phycisphaerae bacterium]
MANTTYETGHDPAAEPLRPLDETAPRTTLHEPMVAQEHAVHRDGKDNRSVGEIVADLRDQFMLLIRQEVALAKRETGEKVSRVSRGAIAAATGGIVAYTGLILMLLALCVGLAMLIDGWVGLHALWISPLLVGLVLGIIGMVMFSNGKKTVQRESAVPEQTAASLKEDQQWAKHQMNR